MLRELRRHQRALFLALLTATTLAACGGGGDDDEDDEDVIEDEDATGLWQGNFTQAGVSRPLNVMAAPSGQFFGIVSATPAGPGRFMVGTGDVTQNILNATGTVFAPAGVSLPNGQSIAALTIAAGRVTTGVTLSGNYSAGGETATLSLNFDAKTNRSASLATISGIYSLTPTPTDPNANAVLTINNSIATFATGSGCNGDGSVGVINGSLNIYTWTLTIAACNGQPATTFNGLATLGDPVGGSANTLIVMLGTTAARDRPFVFAGTK
jgi:hypothetical protein